MELNNRLYSLLINKAKKVKVEIVSIGIGYTAVTTTDGGMGLAYTYFKDKTSCVLLNKTVDYEVRPASDLLKSIKSENTIERSMALALINALNYDQALKLPEDKKNQILFDEFKKAPVKGLLSQMIMREYYFAGILDPLMTNSFLRIIGLLSPSDAN